MRAVIPTMSALLLFMLLASQLEASSYRVYTAGWLRDVCSSSEAAQRIGCYTFITGFLHGRVAGIMEVIRKYPHRIGNKLDVTVDPEFSQVCMPDNVPPTQIAEMFIKRMNDMPEKLHEPAFPHLLWMLEKHFPCRTK